MLRIDSSEELEANLELGRIFRGRFEQGNETSSAWSRIEMISSLLSAVEEPSSLFVDCMLRPFSIVLECYFVGQRASSMRL